MLLSCPVSSFTRLVWSLAVFALVLPNLSRAETESPLDPPIPGTVDDSFHPGAGIADVTTIALQAGGKIIVGGSFTNFDGRLIHGVFRLNVDGSVDTNFNVGKGVFINGDPGMVSNVAVQPDGKIIVAGYFNTINGITRWGLARLNPDGGVDLTFVPYRFPSISSYDSVPIVVQPDGKIVAKAWRLKADGSLDPTFRTSFNAFSSSLDSVPANLVILAAIALQADGKILCGGRFTSVHGIPRNSLVRLTPTGLVDLDFDAQLPRGSGISQIVEDTTGRIMIGGSFDKVGQIPRNSIARLGSDGRLDTTFDPGSGVDEGGVSAIALQNNRKIVIGGTFGAYNGRLRRRIARLNYDGTLDLAFDSVAGPGGGLFDGIHTIVPQSNGKLLAAGRFSHFSGVAKKDMVRLHGDPFLFGPAITNGTFTLQLTSLPQRNHILEFKDSLTETNWISVSLFLGDGGLITLTDPDARSHQRFYRVRLE